jgi:prevent-host-death family protein
MKQTRVSELKASLSRYLARVKAGEEILVTEHGRPVAKLVPVAGADQADDDRLAALERAGVIRVADHALPAEFWRRARPADPEAAARAALITERREGR